MANVIDEIEENVEKGEEAIVEVVEKGKELIEDIVEKVKGKKKSPAKKAKSDEAEDKELEKKAEAESTDPVAEKTLEEKKKELLEKAKKLAEKVDVTKSEELKEQVKIKKRADMLIPLEEYVKSGIYLGTRVVTPKMKQYVYRRRADGLAIFNTDLIDEKLKEGIEFSSKFNPEDVILVCKRQAGWKAAEMFGQITGCLPGAVPPFGSAFGIATHVDNSLEYQVVLNYHFCGTVNFVDRRLNLIVVFARIRYA